MCLVSSNVIELPELEIMTFTIYTVSVQHWPQMKITLNDGF